MKNKKLVYYIIILNTYSLLSMKRPAVEVDPIMQKVTTPLDSSIEMPEIVYDHDGSLYIAGDKLVVTRHSEGLPTVTKTIVEKIPVEPDFFAYAMTKVTSKVIMGGKYGKLLMVDTETGALDERITLYGAIWSLAAHPRHNHVFTAGTDTNILYMWDTRMRDPHYFKPFHCECGRQIISRLSGISKIVHSPYAPEYLVVDDRGTIVRVDERRNTTHEYSRTGPIKDIAFVDEQNFVTLRGKVDNKRIIKGALLTHTNKYLSICATTKGVGIYKDKEDDMRLIAQLADKDIEPYAMKVNPTEEELAVSTASGEVHLYNLREALAAARRVKAND